MATTRTMMEQLKTRAAQAVRDAREAPRVAESLAGEAVPAVGVESPQPRARSGEREASRTRGEQRGELRRATAGGSGVVDDTGLSALTRVAALWREGDGLTKRQAARTYLQRQDPDWASRSSLEQTKRVNLLVRRLRVHVKRFRDGGAR